MSFTSLDIENIKYFVRNAKVRISVHHDSAKFYFDDVNDFASRLVFINIDRHSDFHLNISNEALTPANWCNFVLLENELDSFYWVYPLDIVFDKSSNYPLDIGPLTLKNKSFIPQKPYIKRVYLDRINSEILSSKKIQTLKNNCMEFEIEYFYKNNNLKEVLLNISNLNTLPIFKSQQIFCSIDADYFSSNSFSPIYSFINEKFLYQRISSFLKIVKKKKLQPNYLSLTYSPNYILPSHYRIISDFFNLLKKYSI